MGALFAKGTDPDSESESEACMRLKNGLHVRAAAMVS
jgi:hypothetical protein